MKKINEVVEKIKTNRKIQIVLIVFLFLIIALLILNMFLPSPKSNEVANIAPPPNLIKKIKATKRISKKQPIEKENENHKKHIVIKKRNSIEEEAGKIETKKVVNKNLRNEKLNLDKKKVYVYKGELLVDGKINDKVIVNGDIYKKGDILFGKEIEKIEGNYVYFDDGTKYSVIIK